MSSRISINNYINKKNQYEVEEKNVFKYKKPIINNNNISYGLNDNKAKYNNLKDKELQKKPNYNFKEEEDYYKNDIYNKNISKYKYYFDLNNDEHLYNNTISSFNSFHKKYKDIYTFTLLKKSNNNKRKYRNDNNLDALEIHSDLNLTFEENNKKDIFLTRNSKLKLIDKDKSHFMKIIRIFDINHKKYQNKNSKYNSKNKNIVYNTSSKNKNKNISKYSKKNKKYILNHRNNNNNLVNHTKSSSQPFVETNSKNNRNHHVHEINNRLTSTERKSNIITKEEEIDLSSLNNMKSVSKNIFLKYSPNTPSISIKSFETSKVEEESERNKKSKNPNIFIGLNKKYIVSNNNGNNGPKINEFNYNDSNKNNSKVGFRYSNRKSKSMFENDYLKENNNKFNKISNISNIFETEQKQQEEPKVIFKRIDNIKQGKKKEEKEKYEAKRNYNKYIYPSYNVTNINEKNGRKSNNYNISNKLIKDDKKNGEEVYLTKITLGTPVKKELNISYVNKRKHLPITINENNNHNNLNENLLNNNVGQKKTSESSKKNLNSQLVFQNNMLSQNKNNIYLTKSVSNIPVDLNNPIIITEIMNSKQYKNSEDPHQNKGIIISNRSSAMNSSRASNDKQDNNRIELKLNKEKKLYNNKYLITNKDIMSSEKSEKIKDIKPERIITSHRYYFNRFKINNKNNNQLNSNQNNKYNGINLISKYEHKNNISNINNKEKEINKNQFENKYKINKEIDKNKNNKNDNINNNDNNNINKSNNKTDAQQLQRSNKFQRSNHKYHEIKSISNEKNIKKIENGANNIVKNKIRNQIVNSTSMDNLKPLRRTRNYGSEIEIKINDIIYNKEIYKENDEKKANYIDKKNYNFFGKK